MQTVQALRQKGRSFHFVNAAAFLMALSLRIKLLRVSFAELQDAGENNTRDLRTRF